MSTKWSYSGDPSSSQKDAIRFRIGDTDPKDKIFTDAEINYAVVTYGTTLEAAIYCCRSAAAKYARLVMSWTETRKGDQQDRVRLSYDQKFQHFQKLTQELVDERRRGLGNVFAGGQSRAGKRSEEENTDRVPPFFTRDMHRDLSILPRNDVVGDDDDI